MPLDDEDLDGMEKVAKAVIEAEKAYDANPLDDATELALRALGAVCSPLDNYAHCPFKRTDRLDACHEPGGCLAALLAAHSPPSLDAEVRERLDIVLGDLDAAASPTKCEVFTACGWNASQLADDIRALLSARPVDENRGVEPFRTSQDSPAQPLTFWLWRNGDYWLAFDTPWPFPPGGGDPSVIGEPEFIARQAELFSDGSSQNPPPRWRYGTKTEATGWTHPEMFEVEALYASPPQPQVQAGEVDLEAASAEFEVHVLKTHPAPFAAVRSRKKKLEIRRADRNFKEGDTLWLEEYDPATDTKSGQVEVRIVTHVLPGGQYGIEDGYAALSIDDPSSAMLSEALARQAPSE